MSTDVRRWRGPARRQVATRASSVARAIESLPRPVRRGASVLAAVLAWWALVRFRILGFEFFVSPVAAAGALGAHLAGAPVADGGTIYRHAAYTAGRVVVGTALAVTVAVPLGLIVGTRRRVERYVYPALEFLRPIPPIAWVPLVLVIFPTVRIGVVFVVFLGAFFPTLVNTVRGVQAVDAEYRQAAASLGAGDRQLLRQVVLPAALPSVLTGVTVGVGLGWITVVAAEMITGEYGLGHVIFQAYRLVEIESVVVGMIAIGFLGAVSTALVSQAAAWANPWLAEAPTGRSR